VYKSLPEYIRKIAINVSADDGYGESPYLNIPIYQNRIEPEEDSTEIGMGPPSMYNDFDESDRCKNKEDMRRQGPRPQPSDRLDKEYEHPVTDTAPAGEPRENLQGGPWNDTTKPRGSDIEEDNNRDTYAPDEGDLTSYNTRGDVAI